MAKKRVYFMYPWDWESRKQYYIPWFPMSEYEQRVKALKRKMQETKVDAVFLYGDVRQYGFIRWLTNFYPQLGESFAVQTLDGDPILLSNSTAHGEPMHSFIYESWVKDVRMGLFHDLPAEDHPTLLSRVGEVIKEKKLTKAKIGVVGIKLLGYDLFTGMKEAFPNVTWSDWQRSWETITAVKSKLEMECFETGAEGIDAGFEAAFRAAKPGVTELEVAGAFEYAVRKANIDVVHNLFDTRVCTGPRSFLKNCNPTERRMEHGDAFFMDISAQYRGYCLDVSSSHVVGSDPNPEQLKLFEASAQMTEAMIAAAKPGALARDMVEITRAVAEEHGYGDLFCEYIVGHGMGTCQLQIPRFNPDSEDVLEEGMVFALEPMIIHPVHGSGCIERICAVGPDGGRLLSKLTLRPWTVSW